MPIMLAMMPSPSTISTMTEMKASRSNASLTSMPMTSNRALHVADDRPGQLKQNHLLFQLGPCIFWTKPAPGGLFDQLAEAENVRLMEKVEGDPEHGRDERGDDR